MVVGTPVYRAGKDEALAAITGYATSNDVSMRDWQRRTLQWRQARCSSIRPPVGPYLVTPDEVGHAVDLEIRCEVDGAVMQQARASDLLFTPADIVVVRPRRSRCAPATCCSPAPPGVSATRESRRFTSSQARYCAPMSRDSASA